MTAAAYKAHLAACQRRMNHRPLTLSFPPLLVIVLLMTLTVQSPGQTEPAEVQSRQPVLRATVTQRLQVGVHLPYACCFIMMCAVDSR